MSIREELILKVLAKEESVVELSQQYGVARKTIYKWLKRYQSHGLSGLVDAQQVMRTEGFVGWNPRTMPLCTPMMSQLKMY